MSSVFDFDVRLTRHFGKNHVNIVRSTDVTPMYGPTGEVVYQTGRVTTYKYITTPEGEMLRDATEVELEAGSAL